MFKVLRLRKSSYRNNISRKEEKLEISKTYQKPIHYHKMACSSFGSILVVPIRESEQSIKKLLISCFVGSRMGPILP
jgi:hypothetical protein